MTFTLPPFTRREHERGFDSICMTCFLSVAEGKTQDEIALAEETHACAFSINIGNGREMWRACGCQSILST
jgi:hypothetical protein